MCFDLQYCMLLAEVHDLPHNNKHLKYKAKLPGIRNRTRGKKIIIIYRNSTNANPDYYCIAAVAIALVATAIAVTRHTISTLHQHYPKAFHLYHSHSYSLTHSLSPSDIPFFNHNKTNFTTASKSTWKWMDGVAEKREEK